jgi:hypothetical protein
LAENTHFFGDDKDLDLKVYKQYINTDWPLLALTAIVTITVI